MDKPNLDFSTKRFLCPPMHPEGFRFVLAALALAGILSWVWWPLVIPGLALTYGVYLFFRNPDRVPPADPAALVSPADGLASLIERVPFPEELAAAGPAAAEETVWRVSVFMSVLNAHVNRAPAAGVVEKRVYVPGKFFNASMDKASKDNERMLYLLRMGDGRRIAFVQIAGLIARRIVSFAEEGRPLERAERFGLIRFGSRVDVYLPPGVEPCVGLGQVMVAGETVIARL